MKRNSKPIIAGWWKGKKQTKEHIEKRAAAIRGIKRSKEYCESLSRRQKGRKLSKSWKEAIAKGVKKRFSKKGYEYSLRGLRAIQKAAKKRRGKPPWNKGKKVPPHKNPWRKKKYRERHCRRRKEEWKNSDFRKRQGRSRRRTWKKQEVRQRHSKIIAKTWLVEKRRKDHEKVLAKIVCPSGIQVKIWHKFKWLGFKLEHPIFGYQLDIAHPKMKIDIEIDGSFWHKDSKKKDRRRDRRLRKAGWAVIRIGDKQMKDSKFLNKLYFSIKAKQERERLKLQ